jgi:ABC-2 type transport system ATP-binding protein
MVTAGSAIYCSQARKAFYVSEGATNGTKPRRGLGGLVRRRRRRIVAVNDVSFSVSRGEIYGILGPNGSGKSTLIRLLATLLLPDSGEIRVLGSDVVRQRMAVRRVINRVSVDAAFFKKLSALENLRYASRLYGLDVRAAERAAVQILERLGLEGARLTESMEDLSRGMQQKVAIARAFLNRPQVLLLDEPTTGLDPKSKLDVQGFVRDARGEQGTTVILTSHDMVEADKMCDRVAFIDRGQFVVTGTPALLRSRYSEGAQLASLEDVFLKVTGQPWPDEDPEGGES